MPVILLHTSKEASLRNSRNFANCANSLKMLVFCNSIFPLLGRFHIFSFSQKVLDTIEKLGQISEKTKILKFSGNSPAF